jgi:hypothetical protein
MVSAKVSHDSIDIHVSASRWSCDAGNVEQLTQISGGIRYSHGIQSSSRRRGRGYYLVYFWYIILVIVRRPVLLPFRVV